MTQTRISGTSRPSGRTTNTSASTLSLAANGVRAILKFLESFPGWRPQWGPIGFGVAFPEAAFQSEPTPAFRPELVIDQTHLLSPVGLEGRLRAVMSWYPKDQFRQGDEGAKKLIVAVNHDLVIDRPLGLQAEGVDQAIAELSPRQYQILRYFKNRRRLAVSVNRPSFVETQSF